MGLPAVWDEEVGVGRGRVMGMAIGGQEEMTLTSERGWEGTGYLGGRTIAGVNVGPASAMSLSAYFACKRNICEDVAKLPFKVYKNLKPRGKEEDPAHPAFRLLNEAPNEEMTSQSFIEALTDHAQGWGTGYAEIVRDAGNRASAMWPIHPSRVRLKRDDAGRLYYEVTTYAGAGALSRDVARGSQTSIIEPRNMFVLRGAGGDGLCGYSILQFAKECLGAGLAAQQYAGAFFGNGATPGGFIEHPGKLGDAAYERLKTDLNQKYGGSENAHKTAILEEGMKWNISSIPPEQAQFLETRQFQVEEICRWFRMPPHKIQHLARSTFSNIEMQAIEYVVDCLMTWLRRWEIEAKLKLLGQPSHFAKFTLQGLLRGDSAARGTFYQTLSNIGAASADDIRELEDWNPIPNGAGEKYLVQVNLAPIEMVADGTHLESKSGADARGKAAEREALINEKVRALQAEVEDKKFKRELILALVKDATTGDVLYNAMEISELLKGLGIAMEPGYLAPWLPVQDAAGRPVTGEVVKDPEGDIIGGKVEEGSEKEEKTGGNGENGEENNAKAQRGKEADGGGVDAAVVLGPVIEDMARRMGARVVKVHEAARRAAKGDEVKLAERIEAEREKLEGLVEADLMAIVRSLRLLRGMSAGDGAGKLRGSQARLAVDEAFKAMARAEDGVDQERVAAHLIKGGIFEVVDFEKQCLEQCPE